MLDAISLDGLIVDPSRPLAVITVAAPDQPRTGPPQASEVTVWRRGSCDETIPHRIEDTVNHSQGLNKHAIRDFGGKWHFME